MKSLVLAVILVVASALPSFAEEDACDMLFVQSARNMAYDGKNLILIGADPNIIFFCDRPVRAAGHLTRKAFFDLVSKGNDTFAENHPNASVSVFDADNNVVASVVVELHKRPVVSGDRLIFPVKVVDGELAEKGDATVVFIDPIGRPLSPGSVAGVHRRHRRRAIRRAVR